MHELQVIFIMGVSGSGKTTIGKLLSAKADMPFFDGDDFHPTANVEKMKAGIALSDEDRAGWLRTMANLAKEQLKQKGAVIACSALKKKYRSILSAGIEQNVKWIFLNGPIDLVRERMKERQGHYMPPTLLQSQFDILEAPEDCILVDIQQTPAAIVDQLVTSLQL